MSDEPGGDPALEELEDSPAPRTGPFVIFGLLMTVPGCLLAAFAALSALNVGPFPGLLQNASGLIGFFPKDLLWGIGVVGVILALAGLVTLSQAAQNSD